VKCNAALAAHRLDQFLGAEIGRIAGIRTHAEQGGRRILEATGGGDGHTLVVDDLLHHSVGADGTGIIRNA
jgi:hypothetical protein